MDDETQPFARWLNATMQTRGLSQAAVARNLGVADAQVSRWRRGQVIPSVRYLQQLATTFDVPRARLEQMAGYPTEETVEGIDPAVDAELDALSARFRALLERDVPPDLWQTYADACEALAARLADSFGEVADSAHDEAGRKRHHPVGFRT
jgi:transcriptional regulator with XRE-family HTH domain